MEDLVNGVNWNWQSSTPTRLAAYALWEVNHIHPFVNGNGRTARAVCYYILCMKFGRLLPGKVTLPEFLRVEPNRTLYYSALTEADKGDLSQLDTLIMRLLREQIVSGS